ncbi:MAG TPA: family 20 glycosylhydrolase [Terriglobales bacterium]|nr:family 20 glycosylhydrolase [Terriglobales bacterium]
MTKLLFAACLMMGSLMFAQTPPPAHSLMPVPASLQFKDGRLPLDASLKVFISGHSDARLQNAVGRMLKRLEGRIGLPLSRDYKDSAAKLTIECSGPGKEVAALDEDESYTLDVDGQRATLKAKNVVGCLRGMETLLQLLSADKASFFLPAVAIQDAPRYPWRGLLIDVARHYEPMEVLKRNIDAMATVKLNVLHWHLTEDQGFRVESKKYPKLHEMGSDGLYYTQDQVREIIAYAHERGIRVVPEFDMPGHVQSWLVGHPELAAGPGPYEISREWGVMDATFDPTNEKVYKLLDGFIGEMAKLFPDAYLHIGGDENNGKWWTANANIQAFIKKKGLKDNHALQTHFNQRLLKILEKHHKRMMGWDEILHPDLPKTAVIHSWRNSEALVQAAKQGYDSVLSAPYYIDLMQPTSFHYKDIIADDNALSADEKKHILGGEATMWSEWVTPDTIDSRIWPRTAAIAEKFWSPAGTTDIKHMYRRMNVVSLQLEELGLTHKKNVAMILRRLRGNDDTKLLEEFLGVVEPVKGYRRGRLQPPGLGALMPLTRLVDAANTDSREGRRTEQWVDELLNDTPGFSSNADDLLHSFADWQKLSADLQPVLDSSPVLQEAIPMSLDLGRVASVATEALRYLRAGQVPPAEWAANSKIALDRAAQSTFPLELSVLRPVRELTTAAAELGQLQTMGKDKWRAHVKQTAFPPPPPRR